jgi:spore maturation protein SpmA
MVVMRMAERTGLLETLAEVVICVFVQMVQGNIGSRLL